MIDIILKDFLIISEILFFQKLYRVKLLFLSVKCKFAFYNYKFITVVFQKV